VCVSFACRFMVNLTAFWLTEVRGLLLLYVLVSGVLGGHLVPVQLFPDWLQASAYVTPFPAMIQFPINLVTGQATGLRAVAEVAAQVAWAAGLLLLGRLVLSRATRPVRTMMMRSRARRAMPSRVWHARSRTSTTTSAPARRATSS